MHLSEDPGASASRISACLVVEDTASTRLWLTEAAARAFPGVQIDAVGGVRDALEWLRRHDATPRAILIVDLALPDGSGLDVVRAATACSFERTVVVSTIFNDDEHLLSAFKAGAQGYLLKDGDFSAIAERLSRVCVGEPPLSPSIARRLLRHFRDAPAVANDAELTPRESDTLRLIARGLTVSEAAAELGLKPQTVAGYVKIIYQKLNISSRAQAAREAIRRGMV
jgi:DNA-binding NarL/FixJ family response regulator